MKPFNLEEAKAGKLVCTRDGKKVRIICFDWMDLNYPIIALVRIKDTEFIHTYTKEGNFNRVSDEQSFNDLMMADDIHEGYINIYKKDEGVTPGEIIYETEENAKKYATTTNYVDTVKIQWKE